MIDIHCHILPALDDGPLQPDVSLDMARMAVKDGIKSMLATPHVSDGTLSAELISQRLADFNSLLAAQQVPLQILAGAEVAVQADLPSLAGYLLHKGPYLLLEFPHTHVPENAGQFLYDVQSQGFLPIIAHPERNGAILRDPALLLELVDRGVLVQLTGASVLGDFGPHIQQCAHYLLRRGAVHFLASDAHSAKHRKPVLNKARKMAARIIGKAGASRLVETNPQAVIDGIPFS